MKMKISSLLILVLLGGLILPSQPAFSATPKPTLAQIEAAKKAEAKKKKIAADALKRLEAARGNLKALTAIANAARAKYVAAQRELVVATTKSQAATKAYQEAAASVAYTHREIGKLAIHAYTSGGGVSDLEAVLSASGPQDMMDRLSTIENLGVKNKTALTRFKAAEEIAARQLPQAHETLEAVRDLLAEQRRRSGVVVFSDHMNAYHLEMERALIDGPKWLLQDGHTLRLVAQAGVLVNLVMFAFNLFPLPPLDGGRVMTSVLPMRWKHI